MQLSASATFTKDLGLDSLDAVEVVMAIEEEFGIEIPDAEADEITTVKQGERISDRAVSLAWTVADQIAIDYIEKVRPATAMI